MQDNLTQDNARRSASARASRRRHIETETHKGQCSRQLWHDKAKTTQYAAEINTRLLYVGCRETCRIMPDQCERCFSLHVFEGQPDRVWYRTASVWMHSRWHRGKFTEGIKVFATLASLWFILAALKDDKLFCQPDDVQGVARSKKWGGSQAKSRVGRWKWLPCTWCGTVLEDGCALEKLFFPFEAVCFRAHSFIRQCQNAVAAIKWEYNKQTYGILPVSWIK